MGVGIVLDPDGGAHRFRLITGDADVVTAADRSSGVFAFPAGVCLCLHLRSAHLVLRVTMDTEAAGLKLSLAVTCTPHMLTDRETGRYRWRASGAAITVV